MPTISEILALPEMSRGHPKVLAGADQVDREVRWVHISEHHDIARLMYGGELVLTTGVAWPDGTANGVQMIRDLADRKAACAVMELVRRYTSMPRDMVAEAKKHNIPLIGLEREIRFIDITYAVHALIIDEQLRELRLGNEAHRTFTRLDVQGGHPEAVLKEVTRLTGRPVVLESLSHQVSAFSAGDMPEAHLLAQWESRSRRAGGMEEGPGSRWLVADVEARGQRFGRLVLLADDELPIGSEAVLERAATTVALNRLVDRDEDTLERHAHGGLLASILQHSYTSPQWVELRAESMGVPLRDQRLIGLVVDVDHAEPPASGRRQAAIRREDSELTAAAIREAGVKALVGSIGSTTVGVLLAIPPHQDSLPVIDTVARAIHRSFTNGRASTCTIGVGSDVTSVEGARRSLLEAGHAAESVPTSDDDRIYYRISDVGVTGFAHLLRDDPRLQLYVERMLGRLIADDEARNGDLLAVLTVYLESGGNKSMAADRFGLSRPAFYSRLKRIESILGVDLDDVETRTSLHLAVVARQRIRASAVSGVAADL